jgi:hypothetical protein
MTFRSSGEVNFYNFFPCLPLTLLQAFVFYVVADASPLAKGWLSDLGVTGKAAYWLGVTGSTTRVMNLPFALEIRFPLFLYWG